MAHEHGPNCMCIKKPRPEPPPPTVEQLQAIERADKYAQDQMRKVMNKYFVATPSGIQVRPRSSNVLG